MVVDDDVASLSLLEEILHLAGFEGVQRVTDPAQTVKTYNSFRPDVVLLELCMPGLDGFAVIEQLIERTSQDAPVPIIVLAADADPATRRRALAAGARDFVLKPFDPIEVRLRIGNLLETRALQLRLRSQNRLLEEQVRNRMEDLQEAHSEILARLALAAEYRDDETGEHAQRVGRLSAMIAKEMGLADDDVELIRKAAPLHDVGKVGVSDTILLKPGPLTKEEFEKVQTHTAIGARILSGSEVPLLQLAEEIALSHHEHWDGDGYSGLAGDDIPLAGRIVCLADVFDALTHDRPYKTSWPTEAAVHEITSNSGTKFDPLVVAAFLKVAENGGLEGLTSDGESAHRTEDVA